MGLPLTITSATPAGSDSPSQGDDELRGIKDYLVSVFGAPNNTAVTAAAFSISAGGVVTVAQDGFTFGTMVQGPASNYLIINSQYTGMEFRVATQRLAAVVPSGIMMYGRFLESASASPFVLGTTGTATMVLRTNSTERMSIDASGNFDFYLRSGHINMNTNVLLGSDGLTMAIGDLSMATGRLTVIGGRTGIGTGNPTQTLHVAGWSHFATRMDMGGIIRLDVHASGRMVLPVGTGLYAS